MAKVNQIVIDEKGNMKVEFSCYEGGECVLHEEKLREELVALGIAITVDSVKRKAPAQIEEETRTGQASSPRARVKS